MFSLPLSAQLSFPRCSGGRGLEGSRDHTHDSGSLFHKLYGRHGNATLGQRRCVQTKRMGAEKCRKMERRIDVLCVETPTC